MVYVEALRDVSLTGNNKNRFATNLAGTTVHELGHQFDVAAGIQTQHRNNVDNIMIGGTWTIDNTDLTKFVFHVNDVDAIRDRIESPGKR